MFHRSIQQAIHSVDSSSRLVLLHQLNEKTKWNVFKLGIKSEREENVEFDLPSGKMSELTNSPVLIDSICLIQLACEWKSLADASGVNK